jgi:hypothetical protein
MIYTYPNGEKRYNGLREHLIAQGIVKPKPVYKCLTIDDLGSYVAGWHIAHYYEDPATYEENQWVGNLDKWGTPGYLY